MAKCGKPVAPFTGLQWYLCVLAEGHEEGKCSSGGTCTAHGEYIGQPNAVPQCPRWPECIKDALKAAAGQSGAK